MKTGKPQFCYLCAMQGANSKDHIPPRGVFPDVPAGQLITVPAHIQCNNQFSQDDNDLRIILAVEAADTPTGRQAWSQQVFPDLQKHPNLMKRLASQTRLVVLPDGQKRLIHLQDSNVIERQVERWTRGLYLKQFGKPYPPQALIESNKQADMRFACRVVSEIQTKRSKAPGWKIVEPGVFRFFYAVPDDDPLNILAVYVFHEHVAYAAWTRVQTVVPARPDPRE